MRRNDTKRYLFTILYFSSEFLHDNTFFYVKSISLFDKSKFFNLDTTHFLKLGEIFKGEFY